MRFILHFSLTLMVLYAVFFIYFFFFFKNFKHLLKKKLKRYAGIELSVKGVHGEKKAGTAAGDRCSRWTKNGPQPQR